MTRSEYLAQAAKTSEELLVPVPRTELTIEQKAEVEEILRRPDAHTLHVRDEILTAAIYAHPVAGGFTIRELTTIRHFIAVDVRDAQLDAIAIWLVTTPEGKKAATDCGFRTVIDPKKPLSCDTVKVLPPLNKWAVESAWKKSKNRGAKNYEKLAE